MIEGLGTRLLNLRKRLYDRDRRPGNEATQLQCSRSRAWEPGNEARVWAQKNKVDSNMHMGRGFEQPRIAGVWSDSNHNNVQLAVFARSATVCTALQTR